MHLIALLQAHVMMNLRNNVLPEEAVFNVPKYPNECNAVFAAGIATIQRQKGTVTWGFTKGINL